MPTDTDYTILLTVTTTSTLESSSLRGGHKTVITIPNVTTATLTVAPSSQTPKLSTTSDTEDEASLTHKLQMTTKSSSNSRASVTTHHSLASTIGLSGNSKASNSLRDDNLLKLGLSVGLPIAIISLFVVGILGWYFTMKMCLNESPCGLFLTVLVDLFETVPYFPSMDEVINWLVSLPSF